MAQESGTIKAIGEGQITLNVDFQPVVIEYYTTDDPHDPGPLSAVPVQQETTKLLMKQTGPSSWYVTISWVVFGVKNIYWNLVSA